MQKKICAFIILHYLSEDMTIKCVESIEKAFNMDDFAIIIIDNASSNGSGQRLKEKYDKKQYCNVIINQYNTGYAIGNNIGYRYAKDNYDCDFIIVMNNDVIIEDEFFLCKVSKIYYETQFSVLGPDILAYKKSFHQNPMRISGYTEEDVVKIIESRKRRLRVLPLYYGWNFCSKKIKKVVKTILGKRTEKIDNPYAIQKRIENPVLHGACLIFSRPFLSKEQVLFNEKTFLYMEEDILHYRCLKKGYKMVYDSSIFVKHMEDVSTDLAFGTGYKKLRMKYNNLVNSARVLLDEMSGGNDENCNC